MNLVIGISGASGTHLGVRFLEYLPENINIHIIISNSAKYAYLCEKNRLNSTNANLDSLEQAILSLHKKKLRIYADDDMSAPIASGSYLTQGMAIIPTSAHTLAKIALGISDTLLTRVAAVMLKEKRSLLLGVREMPFSPIMLEHMQKLSALGVHIAPPVASFYAAKSLEEMEKFFIGKWFDCLNIEHNLFTRWGE